MYNYTGSVRVCIWTYLLWFNIFMMSMLKYNLFNVKKEKTQAGLELGTPAGFLPPVPPPEQLWLPVTYTCEKSPASSLCHILALSSNACDQLP